MSERESKDSGFVRDIIRTLTSPRNSFKSILKKPSLKKATVLILVIAIVAAWASFNYGGKLPLPDLDQDQQPLGPGQLTQLMMIVSAMMAIIGVFGTWLLSSVLVHGISRPLGGKGTFRDMLMLAGYASTPLLMQHVLRLADSFMISQETLQFTAVLQISANPLLNSIANAAVGIFAIFRLWSIVLLIIATRENYKLSTAKSIVVTVLSFIIIVIVSAFLPFM